MIFWSKKYVVAIWQFRFFGEGETRITNEFTLKHNAIKEYEAWCKDESVMNCTLFKRLRNGNIKILRRFIR